ncbi:hypothetical protein A4R26_14125 [Niastella populi]|uniref:Uncharacterized protein n=1 Tax=Niastella populi TaxID=550983 RepID=A0A1V9G6M1_9BACT|nr:hypothetical protein A4R26_14125 [Niastella populi]
MKNRIRSFGPVVEPDYFSTDNMHGGLLNNAEAAIDEETGVIWITIVQNQQYFSSKSACSFPRENPINL